MVKSRKLAWENWNTKEDELLEQSSKQYKNVFTELTSRDTAYEEEEDHDDGMMGSIEVSVPHVSTPFGVFKNSSVFKPSDRWECWIGHTNFPIGPNCFNILNESIPGVEALSIMGKYTFCIGIAKLFDPADVRRNIENVLCKETTNEEPED